MSYARQVDYTLQLILSIFSLILVFPMFIFGLLAGLFVIGCWQLLSAIINTSAFLNSGMGKEICNYWKYVGIVFFLFFIYYPIRMVNPGVSDILPLMGIVGSVPIAIYYLHIYNKLIKHALLRDEIGGVIKSNHK